MYYIIHLLFFEGNGQILSVCVFPIYMGHIDVLIIQHHRADVLLDEAKGLGLGG